MVFAQDPFRHRLFRAAATTPRGVPPSPLPQRSLSFPEVRPGATVRIRTVAFVRTTAGSERTRRVLLGATREDTLLAGAAQAVVYPQLQHLPRHGACRTGRGQRPALDARLPGAAQSRSAHGVLQRTRLRDAVHRRAAYAPAVAEGQNQPPARKGAAARAQQERAARTGMPFSDGAVWSHARRTLQGRDPAAAPLPTVSHALATGK